MNGGSARARIAGRAETGPAPGPPPLPESSLRGLPFAGHPYYHRLLMRCRDPLLVFALALGLRLAFSALMAGTYDKDEFVYLALGHDVAQGAIPYRDFAFFHPPGILVVLGLLDPLIRVWWPVARVVDLLVDSLTALLVWRIGLNVYGRLGAVSAAVLYAVSPIVLVSAVRVDQEAMITALGALGLALVVVKRSHRAAVLAGLCLGIACWIKYPMLVFLPIYLLAAGRRGVSCLMAWLVATVALFVPYFAEIHLLYRETIAWQVVHRWPTPLAARVQTTAIYWLAVNPLAIGSVLSLRSPLWLVAGFASGGMFIFTSSAYSHYFVPLAPYAALLGAPPRDAVVPTNTSGDPGGVPGRRDGLGLHPQ